MWLGGLFVVAVYVTTFFKSSPTWGALFGAPVPKSGPAYMLRSGFSQNKTQIEYGQLIVLI